MNLPENGDGWYVEYTEDAPRPGERCAQVKSDGRLLLLYHGDGDIKRIVPTRRVSEIRPR